MPGASILLADRELGQRSAATTDEFKRENCGPAETRPSFGRVAKDVGHGRKSRCYWRCYSTDKTQRRHVTIYRDEILGPRNHADFGGQSHGGTCKSVDDIYYCGDSSCEVCDYDF